MSDMFCSISLPQKYHECGMVQLKRENLWLVLCSTEVDQLQSKSAKNSILNTKSASQIPKKAEKKRKSKRSSIFGLFSSQKSTKSAKSTKTNDIWNAGDGNRDTKQETSHQVWIYTTNKKKASNELQLMAIHYLNDPFDCQVMKALTFENEHNDNSNRRLCILLFYDRSEKTHNRFRCFEYFCNDNEISVKDLTKYFDALRYDSHKSSHYIKNIPQIVLASSPTKNNPNAQKRQIARVRRNVGSFLNAKWIILDTDSANRSGNSSDNSNVKHGLVLIFSKFDIIVMKLDCGNNNNNNNYSNINTSSTLNVNYTSHLCYNEKLDVKLSGENRRLYCCDVYQMKDNFSLSQCSQSIDRSHESLFKLAFVDSKASKSLECAPLTFINIIDFSWILHKIAILDDNIFGLNKEMLALNRFGFENVNYRKYLLVTRWISALKNLDSWGGSYEGDSNVGPEFYNMCKGINDSADMRRYTMIRLDNKINIKNGNKKENINESKADKDDKDEKDEKDESSIAISNRKSNDVFVRKTTFVKFWIPSSMDFGFFKIEFNNRGSKLLFTVNSRNQYYLIDCDTMKNLCQSWDTRNDVTINVVPQRNCIPNVWYNNFCLITLPDTVTTNSIFKKIASSVKIHGCYEMYDIIDTFENCDPSKQDYIYNLGFDIFYLIAEYVDNFMIYKKFSVVDEMKSRVKNAYFIDGWLIICLPTDDQVSTVGSSPYLRLYMYNVGKYFDQTQKFQSHKMQFPVGLVFEDLSKALKGTAFESSIMDD